MDKNANVKRHNGVKSGDGVVLGGNIDPNTSCGMHVAQVNATICRIRGYHPESSGTILALAWQRQ